MKKKWSLFLSFISVFAFAQVKWMNIEEAVEAQKKHPKKILISFVDSSVAGCGEMEASTFGNSMVENIINHNFYAVKFDVTETRTVQINSRNFTPAILNNAQFHSFAKFLNVSSAPSIVFVDEKSNPITILNGCITASELEPYLRLISTDEYLKVDTQGKWSNMQNKFKSRIKK